MVDEGTIDFDTDHNVYILGAGFSRYAGLPLLNDFLVRMRESVGWLEKSGYSPESKAVREVLKFRKDAASAAHRVDIDVENIEELFSLASASGDDALARNIALAICGTIEFATQNQPSSYTYIYLPKGAEQPTANCTRADGNQTKGDRECFKIPLYEALAGVMTGALLQERSSGRNTIITLNYDLLLDVAIRALGFEIDYGFEYRTPVEHRRPAPARKQTLLKLHGSVGWNKLGDDVITFHEGYTTASKEMADNPWIAPVVLPPTWLKSVPKELRDVWNTSIEALRSATRIFIIGFSAPDTDTHFKYLLGAGLKDNVSLHTVLPVNPALDDGRTRARLVKLFTDRHVVEQIQRAIPMKGHDLLLRMQSTDHSKLLNRKLLMTDGPY